MELLLKVNARLQPMNRFDLEDALNELLIREKAGEVIGGGTIQKENGEIEYCEIQIHMKKSRKHHIDWLVDLLNRMGIAKGSILEGESICISVGTLEGLAYYSNGTELAEEIYQNCDINYVIEQMELAMGEKGSMYSYWEGPQYTALYFYGPSFEEMKKSIEPFISEYPLCQKSKIEQIS